jgi:hypothetical protein
MHKTELKFLVHESLSQPELDFSLRNALPASAHEERIKESDYYYRAKDADYARVRYSDWGDTLTVAGPKAHITSDLPPGSLHSVAMRSIAGPEVAVLQRTSTYFSMASGVIVATIVAQGFDHVILHIAGDNSRDVSDMAAHLKDTLGESKLLPEPRSDFEMFIAPLMALPESK